MASKIRVLTEHTINKIAAGEVIENPASVVKELVENSIDAGASDICIEIKSGGRQLIRITDNGCGMNNDDALLCLERHATSKIREVEDIHDITTMGFRGEAIPSIASISKFMLLTCPKDNELISDSEAKPGTMIIVDGGKIVNCSSVIRSPGTTIEVKSLFFNVPVRKKFLKSPLSDTNEILKMISLIALGHPNVKFQLISDNKNLLSTSFPSEESFSQQLNNRVEAVLGNDFLDHCISVKHEHEGLHIQGVIGLPSYTRHNRTGQYLFINQRGVFSPLVAYAIKEGYGTALPTGRHPVFVLHLSISGNLVDVNVHPQKREVRLRQEHVLKNLIIKGIEKSLNNTSYYNSQQSAQQISPAFAEVFTAQPSFSSIVPNDEWSLRSKSIPPWEQSNITPQYPTPSFEIPEISEDLPLHTPISQIPPFSTPKLTETLYQPHFSLKNYQLAPQVIATIMGYILLDSEHDFILAGRLKEHVNRGGLFIVDQKAAHTRIIFEKLQENENNQEIPLQSLLIPYSFEVSSYEAALLKSSLDNLQKIGICIKEFGTTTFLIEAIPQFFRNNDLENLVIDLLQALRDTQSDQLLQDEKNKRISLAASKAAISQQRKLSNHEAQLLIDQLVLCRQPYRCPQGKSILLQLSPEEISKLFLKH